MVEPMGLGRIRRHEPMPGDFHGTWLSRKRITHKLDKRLAFNAACTSGLPVE
jgi:hypothetical protein